jgi:hypothetical protein
MEVEHVFMDPIVVRELKENDGLLNLCIVEPSSDDKN